MLSKLKRGGIEIVKMAILIALGWYANDLFRQMAASHVTATKPSPFRRHEVNPMPGNNPGTRADGPPVVPEGTPQ